MECLISWQSEKSESITSIEKLNSLLAEIHEKELSGSSVIVEVVHPVSGSLSIGLGKEKTVLNYVSISGNPPYFISVGDSNLEGTEVFYYYGDWSEYLCRNLVSLQLGLEVVEHFFLTGELSEKVIWEEV